MQQNRLHVRRFCLAILAASALAMPAAADVNVTFNGTDNANWAADGATAQAVGGGVLNVQMKQAANGKWRADLKFNAKKTAGTTCALNATADRYIAIKFAGERPSGGSLKCELMLDDGTTWVNGLNSPNGTVKTDAGNGIYYFDLASKTAYTGDMAVRYISFIIADNQKADRYTVDWIKTFATTDAIAAYKATADDGTADLDEQPVLNQTTGTRYATIKAAWDAAATGELLRLDRTVSAASRLNANSRTITLTAADEYAELRTAMTGSLLFLTNKASGSTDGGIINLENLAINGQNATNSASFIEAGNAGCACNIKNVVFRFCCTTKDQGIVCEKTNGLLTLEGVRMQDCAVNYTKDGVEVPVGFVFVGAGDKVVVKGDNALSLTAQDNNTIKAEGTLTNAEPLAVYLYGNARTTDILVKGCTDRTKFALQQAGHTLMAKNGNLIVAEQHDGSVAIEAADGYATFCADHLYIMPEGLTGYAATVSGDALTLAEAYTAGEVVPASTPLVLGGEVGSYDYEGASDGDSKALACDNSLHGADADGQAAEVEGMARYYKLTYSDDNDNFGFYWGNTDGSAGFQIGTNKAYLALPASGAKHYVIGSHDGSTGISAIETERADEPQRIYNMNGQRVQRAAHGLYIINGKKVIVR